MNEKGTLYFFAGLTSVGKSTPSGLFYKRMKEEKTQDIIVEDNGNKVPGVVVDWSTTVFGVVK